jgi:ABC-2 type transport system ATP-binding protein
MRKLGRKQLTLQLQAPLRQIPAALTAYPLVLAADGNELVYSYDSSQGRAGIAALLQDLSAHGIAFKDLHTTESSLEDIFVGLLEQETAA